MMTRFVRFNTILCLLAALLAVCGCQSTKKSADKEKKKLLAIVEFHLEETNDGFKEYQEITVNRRAPLSLNVDKEPFLDTGYLSNAKLLEEGEGIFSIQLKFNWSGGMRLDTTTTANRGKHMAVFCTFGKNHTNRWLAAPVIRQRISNATLTFTPDATHEEAEAIVTGLNNEAEKIKKEDKW